MEVYTDRNPSWLQWIAPAAFDDADLFRIVIFFVFHSPCPKLSSMGKSLQEYQWNTPWKRPYYLNRQLKQASTNKYLLFSAASYAAMDEALDKSNLNNGFPCDLSRERICIYDNQKNQFMSVFYKEGTKTITFAEIEEAFGSDLSSLTAPCENTPENRGCFCVVWATGVEVGAGVERTSEAVLRFP